MAQRQPPPVLSKFTCSDCGGTFEAVSPPSLPHLLPGRVYCTWSKLAEHAERAVKDVHSEFPAKLKETGNVAICAMLVYCIQELKSRGEWNKHDTKAVEA